MKNQLIIIIAVISLLAQSCGITSQNLTYNSDSEDKYFNITKSFLTENSENSIYFDTSLFDMRGENKSVKKYDIETGLSLFVCSDSSCLHNTNECPFYNKEPDLMYVSDRYIMYKQMNYSDNGVFSEQFMLYDMEAGKARKMCDATSNDYTQVLFTDRYIYFYNITDTENGEWEISICRYDTVTHKIKKIGDSGYSEYHITDRILFAAHNRLYFTDDKYIYSTDYDGNDKYEIAEGSFMYDVITDGEYIYYGKNAYASDDGITVVTLYRMNLDGTNEISLDITCENECFFVNDSEIYYFPYESVDIGKVSIAGYASDTLTLHNGVLCKCTLDGTEKTEVYRFTGDFSYYRFFTHNIIGNCMYGLYTAWEDKDNNGVFTFGEDISSFSDSNFRIIRVNLSDGNTDILEFE